MNNMRGVILVYDDGFFVAGKVKKVITGEITVDDAPKISMDEDVDAVFAPIEGD